MGYCIFNSLKLSSLQHKTSSTKFCQPKLKVNSQERVTLFYICMYSLVVNYFCKKAQSRIFKILKTSLCRSHIYTIQRFLVKWG